MSAAGELGPVAPPTQAEQALLDASKQLACTVANCAHHLVAMSRSTGKECTADADPGVARKLERARAECPASECQQLATLLTIGSKFKTTPCNKQAKAGCCPYQAKCNFAHGAADMRRDPLHQARGDRWGTRRAACGRRSTRGA
jgi:hypothetical protein